MLEFYIERELLSNYLKFLICAVYLEYASEY